MLGMYVGCERAQAVCTCVFLSVRERQTRKRVSLSPQKSVQSSPSLCPAKRLMNLSIDCGYVRTGPHKGSNGPLWTCLSCPSEIGFHYGVNEPNKLITINWRPPLIDGQWEEAQFPQGQRVLITSKVKAIWRQCAVCMKQFTKWHMLKRQWHILNIIWENGRANVMQLVTFVA